MTGGRRTGFSTFYAPGLRGATGAGRRYRLRVHALRAVSGERRTRRGRERLPREADSRFPRELSANGAQGQNRTTRHVSRSQSCEADDRPQRHELPDSRGQSFL